MESFSQNKQVTVFRMNYIVRCAYHVHFCHCVLLSHGQ